MTLGKVFGGSHLNIIDSASRPGLRGSFKYDDEGTRSTKTYLIREGKLTGRLHSRETAAKMHEKPTGNARAINYRHPPIVRMTNTYIEPGECSFEDMIADIKDGVYAKKLVRRADQHGNVYFFVRGNIPNTQRQNRRNGQACHAQR